MYGAKWHRNLAVLVLALASIAGIARSRGAYIASILDSAAPMLAVALLFVAATVRSLGAQTWRALSYALGIARRDALLKSVVKSPTDSHRLHRRGRHHQDGQSRGRRACSVVAIYSSSTNPSPSSSLRCWRAMALGARLGALHGEIRECDARTLTGEVFPVEISVSRVRLNAERLYTAIVRDIRDRRAQQRRLQPQATHDSLTGLPNRAALLAHLETALGMQPVRPALALLMLDLCRFKEVNDTLGHNVGDWVLCNVAQRFASALGDRGFMRASG
jgi:PleD family two-component response regulator